jgi:hypothetical protein
VIKSCTVQVRPLEGEYASRRTPRTEQTTPPSLQMCLAGRRPDAPTRAAAGPNGELDRGPLLAFEISRGFTEDRRLRSAQRDHRRICTIRHELTAVPMQKVVSILTFTVGRRRGSALVGGRRSLSKYAVCIEHWTTSPFNLASSLSRTQWLTRPQTMRGNCSSQSMEVQHHCQRPNSASCSSFAQQIRLLLRHLPIHQRDVIGRRGRQ